MRRGDPLARRIAEGGMHAARGKSRNTAQASREALVAQGVWQRGKGGNARIKRGEQYRNRIQSSSKGSTGETIVYLQQCTEELHTLSHSHRIRLVGHEGYRILPATAIANAIAWAFLQAKNPVIVLC